MSWYDQIFMRKCLSKVMHERVAWRVASGRVSLATPARLLSGEEGRERLYTVQEDRGKHRMTSCFTLGGDGFHC